MFIPPRGDGNAYKNRIPIIRTRRPSGFSEEVLRLFCELEKVKPGRRYNDPRTRQLARLLGLVGEFWSVKLVNDVSGPPFQVVVRI